MNISINTSRKNLLLKGEPMTIDDRSTRGITFPLDLPAYRTLSPYAVVNAGDERRDMLGGWNPALPPYVGKPVGFDMPATRRRIPNPVSVPADRPVREGTFRIGPYLMSGISFPIPEPVTVEDGYRMLEEGETIEEGDEFSLGCNHWRVTSSAGNKVFGGMTYRRKIKNESLDDRILKTLRAVAGNSEEISKLISELECKRDRRR